MSEQAAPLEPWRCHCGGVFAARDDQELEVYCEDCGSHPAVGPCPHCGDPMDTIYLNRGAGECMGSYHDVPVLA